MEILLSSVSTRQLLTGKVLGLGAAGLVQVIVWVISLPLLLHLASSSIGGILSTIHVPISFLVSGYHLLYSGLRHVCRNFSQCGRRYLFSPGGARPRWDIFDI